MLTPQTDNEKHNFIIEMDGDKCVGCNRCIRVCPVETANIAYEDQHKKIKVRIDPSRCILCGACVEICEHEVRTVHDDTEAFFQDIRKGLEISLVIAPSIKTNIPQWKQILTWLRRLGVKSIYDVSLGADICIWAHLRWLEEHGPKPIITQPCPVIVSYCEHYRHELLPYLSPVHSPMACTAVYMRGAGITGAIASISPCIAKSEEHASTGLIQYNITFQGLYRYMEENRILLPEEEGAFDHHDTGPGKLFPLPGGLRENLEFFLGKTLHAEKAEGSAVFKYLDKYAETSSEFLPDVFDVLSCADGCLIGSGAEKEQNIFRLHKHIQADRLQVTEAIEKSRDRLSEYDDTLYLEDYLRSYTAIPRQYEKVAEEDIARAFMLMQKDSYSKRHFNCGACGSDSCYSMARKLALRVNIPMNCVITARDLAQKERSRNAEYLGLVRNIGDNLLSTGDEAYDMEVEYSLRLLSESTHCSAVAIWARADGDSSLKCMRVSGWYGNEADKFKLSTEWPADWLVQLKEGKRLSLNPKKDKPGLFPDVVTNLFIVPIHIRGEFWGFVAAINTDDRAFSDEEASLLESAGILLISGILERQLKRSLVTAKEEALAGTKAKSDFLSRMSHEIRTPLNAIIGMTYMGTNATGLQRKDYCLERIGNASSHLLGVINDILDISKIEADKFELSYLWFDFGKMIENLVAVLIFRMEEKKQNFSVHIDPHIPSMIRGDDQRLSQVITNLLSNAVKFTPEEGDISLTASLAAQEEDYYTIHITVSDTGIGIRDADKERLFRSFEQADSGASRKYGGTGLGLAISRRIVEMMDGSIWVDSVPGKGSTFHFTFKAQGKQHAEEALSREEAPLPITGHFEEACFKGFRILIAEDVEINREIISSMLEPTAADIDFAENGRIALEKIRTAPGCYDLILMDIQMPEMDGYETTRNIRKLDTAYAREVPIIAMTANVFREDIEKCLASGMNDHLGKPIDYNAMMQKLYQYFLPDQG